MGAGFLKEDPHPSVKVLGLAITEMVQVVMIAHNSQLQPQRICNFHPPFSQIVWACWFLPDFRHTLIQFHCITVRKKDSDQLDFYFLSLADTVVVRK